jgi:PAS domain S-box-containing protein
MGLFFQKNDDQFYNAFFSNSVSAMLLLDHDSLQIMDANHAACSFYRYSSKELLEMKLPDLGADGQDPADWFNNTALGIRSSIESSQRISTGEVKSVRINAGAVDIDDKSYIHAIIMDITEKKMQEDALHETECREKELLQETIEMKDSFLTMITHEFKTPIAIINAAIQTLEIVCRDELSDKMRGYIGKIRQNSLRQQRLVENMLDITRLKAGRMKAERRNVEIVSLTREIVESVKVYSDQKHLRLTFWSGCDEVIISTDIEKYERILLNLMSNAIKFTPARRSIDVVMDIRDTCLIVAIRDRGIGIPDDKKLIIFERFGQADSSLTRQAEGTGVGLYLVKLLVDSLDGRIQVTSREGFGSTFSLVLPLQQDATLVSHKINGNKILQAANLECSDIIL